MSNTEEKISVSVVDLHKFDSFKALYENLPLNRCGYDENDIAMASYKDMLAYYSEEEQKKLRRCRYRNQTLKITVK